MGQHYIHNKTIVDDRGIHKPCVEYTVDGQCSSYMTVMTKEDFIVSSPICTFVPEDFVLDETSRTRLFFVFIAL